MVYITTALNNTVKYYKKLFFENDFYRQKKLIDLVLYILNSHPLIG
jgi:hypothetical protein